MPRYHSFSVTFEHSLEGSDQRRVNHVVITVYGESELAIQAEIERQYRTYTNVVILSVDQRQ
ncbi:MAG: hypothetical protein NTZ43_00085 [Gemmatimonadetes bacterium]|nr:hypothetical protein [Gemmatimonadota bacterium]